jgi:hypothetical protein
VPQRSAEIHLGPPIGAARARLLRRDAEEFGIFHPQSLLTKLILQRYVPILIAAVYFVTCQVRRRMANPFALLIDRIAEECRLPHKDA